MGVLDDAIREHLELKRRHGASDEEIAHAEAEALGPARREPGGEPVPEDDFTAGGETELIEPAAADPLDPEVETLHPDVEELHAEAEAPAPDLDAPTEIHPPPEPHDDPLPPPDSSLSAGHEEPVAPQPVEAPGEREAVEPPAPSTRPHGDPAIADDDLEPDEVPADEQLTQRAPLPPHDEARDAPAPVLPPDDPGAPPTDDQQGEERLWFERKPRDFDFDE